MNAIERIFILDNSKIKRDLLVKLKFDWNSTCTSVTTEIL